MIMLLLMSGKKIEQTICDEYQLCQVDFDNGYGQQ